MDQDSEREPEHSPRRIRRGTALSILVGMALFAIVLDLVTKEWATKLDPHEPVRLLGGAVYMSLTRNSGAAFSLLEDHTYIFPIIALVVLSVLGYMARRLRSLPWAIALGMIFGGVFGNLIDRVFRAPAPFHGHVVDFISVFDAHGRAFPIFNVADMALVGGVSLAILLELQGRQRDGSRITSQQQADSDDEPAPGDAPSAAVGSERGSQAW